MKRKLLFGIGNFLAITVSVIALITGFNNNSETENRGIYLQKFEAVESEKISVIKSEETSHRLNPKNH